MIFKIDYPDNFETVMNFFFLQAKASERQMRNFFRGENAVDFSSPLKIWNFFKPITEFRKDPKGNETFQQFETFFNSNKNIHGKSGCGDCDCFAGIVFAAGRLAGLPENKIVLAGRKVNHAVHIYNQISGYYIDLTQPSFNSIRNYPYTQKLKF